MEINIRRLSSYLAGSLPPYYREPISKSKFTDLLSSSSDKLVSTDRLKDLITFSNKDEEFFFMCLERYKETSGITEEHFKEFIKLLELNFGNAIPDDAKYSLIELKKNERPGMLENNSLPTKILIIEDKDGIAIWENFLNNFGINGVKVVTSKSCTNDTWEETIINNKKLNIRYNPLIFRIIDCDGLPDKYLNDLKEKKEQKYNGLSYNIKIFNIHEIENILLLEKTYQSTPLYEKVQDIEKYILNNYDNKFKKKFLSTLTQKFIDNKVALGFDSKTTNFSGEVDDAERELITNPILKINGKQVVDNIRIENKIHKTAMDMLKELKLEHYSSELLSLLEDIKNFFK